MTHHHRRLFIIHYVKYVTPVVNYILGRL